MRITIVAALGRNRVIGTDAGLPWHLPRELKQFRALTTGKPIVLGRKTFDHIGRPLPDRANVVLTRRPDFAPAGVRVVHSADEALAAAREEAARLGADEVMVIGGEEVFRAFLPLADQLVLTVVGGEFAGSATFPVEEIERGTYTITGEQTYAADAKNPYPYTVWRLDRAADGTPGTALLPRLGLT